MTDYSKNERAEQIVGRRLSAEDEARGVIALDQPCELGYWCPVCRVEWDESLCWSEYNGFIWCERCNFDWPSALCVRVDKAPDPEREWMQVGREAAVRVYLDTVRNAVQRALIAKETAPTLAARAAEPISVEEIMRQYGDMNNADYEVWLASRTAVLADAVASELGCDDVSWSVGFSMGVAIAVRFGLTKADLETWATPVDPTDLRSALPREEGRDG